MLRRLLCWLAALSLALLPALSLAETSFSMAGCDNGDASHNWATNQFFVRMQEKTGISFTFSQYDKLADWQRAKDAMFAGGELPDVLFKAELTTEELIRYTASGQLIDLKPLLAENAPNLWALLGEHSDWLSAITLPDGKIGALPCIRPIGNQDALWMNQTWLKNLGLSMPTDMESLREALIAFRDKDPNQNGKADEIPLGFIGPWELKFLSHAYGVTANDYNIYADESGTVRFWPLEDSFAALAKELRSWYQDGLLDANGFQTTDVLRQMNRDEKTERYGVFFAPTPVSVVTYDQAADYTVLLPLAFNDKQVYRDLGGQVTRGAFAITSACADPAALLRWVDTLYTEAGAIEAMVGVEGEDYILTDMGAWQWKGGAESMTSARMSELSVYDTGNMPWLLPQDFYNRYAVEGVNRITLELEAFDAYLRAPFPAYALTPEQSREASALQGNLGRFVDETLARWVLGEETLDDAAVDAFHSALQSRGAEQMAAFWQTIYDQQQK